MVPTFSSVNSRKKEKIVYFWWKSKFHVYNNRVSTKKHIPTVKQKNFDRGVSSRLQYRADLCSTLEMTMICIQTRGCSEPFLEVGAAEFHNEDYVFSNEISLKFPNHQKFSMCRQILPSKKWHELDRKHCHEVDSWREREARFTNLVLARSADLRCLHALQAWF